MTPENSISHSDDDDLDTLTNNSSSDNCPGLEESLEDIYRLLKMALNNCFEEAMDGTEKWLIYKSYIDLILIKFNSKQF